MRLDPISLRVFIAAVEEGTISAAGLRENIAQAAASKRISDLEYVLDTKLIVRTSKGVYPTQAGITLKNMANKVLHELDEIQVHLKDYSEGVRGLVRIVANISVVTQFLPADIKSFMEKYPEVQLQLDEKTSAEIINAVTDNTADIGLFSYVKGHYELDILPYREDRLCLVVPKSHELLSVDDFQFQEALNYEFIALHVGSSINQLVLKVANELGVSVRTKINVTAYDALCLMVESGLGIGVIPLNLAQKYAQIFGIEIIEIKDVWAYRELKICLRDKDSLSPAAKLFVEHLVDFGK